VIDGNGKLDPKFGRGGKLVITPKMLGVDEVYEISNAIEQKDGRIVVLSTGWSNKENTTSFLLFRLKPNGKLDRSFGR
jgi:hypothetical protein